MDSKAIYGRDFESAVDQGLAPEQFKYRFLVEGDSWMDRSSLVQASLPLALAKAFDDAGESALFINLSMFGDTMRHISDCLNDEFFQWINTPLAWKFDALLFSAGGNDFIDAARGPDPGQGILRLVTPAAPAHTADDCFRPDAVGTLVTQFLDPNFAKFYDTVRGSRHDDIPIFLNSYDVPTARNAPAIPGRKAWLFEAYRKNNTPPDLWQEVTERIFVDVEAAVEGWTQGRTTIFRVPTVGTLTPAAKGTTGSSGDWLNEIHPNRGGWAKLAKVWRSEIRKVLPR
jgi:hypothetical protein